MPRPARCEDNDYEDQPLLAGGVRSMTSAYLDRRRDRDQNGAAAGFPVRPASLHSMIRNGVRLAPAGHPLPVVLGGVGAGWAPGPGVPPAALRCCVPAAWAGPRAPALAPAALLRAQPAAGPLAGGLRRAATAAAAAGPPGRGRRLRRPAIAGAVVWAVRSGHAGHALRDGGAGRGDSPAVRRRAVGRPAGVRRAAPRPAGRPAGAHAGHDDAARARGHPAEAEGGLAPADLGPFVRRRACRSQRRRTGAGTACGR